MRSGDDVGIAGFIIQGGAPKRTLVRGIGPSLKVDGTPVPGRLPDPALSLHDRDGLMFAVNNDWRSTQEADISATGLAPEDDKEAAILRRLLPNTYTAVLSGNAGSTGIGLVELYDLESTPNTRLVNISTRGRVDTGDNVLIGGFILRGSRAQRIVVRAIGPDLANREVSGALQDPVLELYNEQGTLVMENDDWKDEQQAEIQESGLPPNDERESAIVRDLGAGNYTAVVSGKNNSTGIGLVEAYNIGSR